MTVTISIMRTTKPAISIFSLTRMLKSRRATPSRNMMKMWAVEYRNRKQVDQAEVETEVRHQAEQRDPSNRRVLSRELCDAHGPEELLGRRFTCRQSLQRL